MTFLFCAIVAFAFFVQSLMGFGGGLIAVPLLSLFMPVKDVVIILILYQFSMGSLLFKIHKYVMWTHVKRLIPAMVCGVAIGIAALHAIPGDVMRLILAGYIILYLLRTHTSVDPLKMLIEAGGAHLSGFLGGAMNAMIGGGAPAFIVYLKDKTLSAQEFRASVTAILFISNTPRIIGAYSTGLITYDLFSYALIAYPGFLVALVLGQKLHGKLPKEIFFKIVTVVLVCAVISLTAKVLI